VNREIPDEPVTRDAAFGENDEAHVLARSSFDERNDFPEVGILVSGALSNCTEATRSVRLSSALPFIHKELPLESMSGTRL
jgi:hypothetical protein